MFAGSDEGAERAAVIYTVLGTCPPRGGEPFTRLKDGLEKLAAGWKQSDIGLLLPNPELDLAA